MPQKFYRRQGGQVNIFVNDDGMQVVDEKTKNRRLRFYKKHGIAFVARPEKPGGEERKGKFKKASNMNYCLNISEAVKKEMTDGGLQYQQAAENILRQRNQEFLIGGSVIIGDIILLVDCDTRVPVTAIYDTVGEFSDENVGYTQHLTTALRITDDYWQATIGFFTNQIYRLGIRLACSLGDPCPLVGHNAFLRWTALQEVADKSLLPSGYIQFWTESNVSEDFELSMKMAIAGYIGRYCVYTGSAFQEGISLSFHDEMMRLKKFTYGACETIFTAAPSIKETKLALLSPLFKKFLQCKNVPFASKINIISYLGSYFAMASAFLFLVFWMTGLAFFPGALASLQRPLEIWTTVVFVFSFFVPISTVVMQHRLDESHRLNFIDELWTQIKYIPMISLLFGGVLFHLTVSCLSFLTGQKVTWTATVKEIPKTSFLMELRLVFVRYWKTYVSILIFGLYWGFLVLLEKLSFRSNVTVPVVVFIGYHFTAPILLNPYIMKFQY
ncbi:unnamed protein product [Heterosigma akashiwo]